MASPVGVSGTFHTAMPPLVTERVMHHPALMHHLPIATHYDHPIIPLGMPMMAHSNLQRPIIVNDFGQQIPNPSTSMVPLPHTLEAHNYYQDTPMPSAYEPVPQQQMLMNQAPTMVVPQFASRFRKSVKKAHKKH